MVKKILVLAATAVVSFNASADYIRYDFSGPVTGYFIRLLREIPRHSCRGGIARHAKRTLHPLK
jgi:hypothetical protein